MIADSDIMAKPIKGLSTLHVVDLVSSDDNKKYEPAGLMAVAIIEIMQENGECLPQDLHEKGFTTVEVAKHWHLAKSLAAVEFRLMGSSPSKLKSVFGRRQ